VVLATQRIVLGPLTSAYLDDLEVLHNDPEVMRYINGGAPVPRADIEDWLQKPGRYVAKTRDGEFLGWFGLRTPPTGELVGELPGDLDVGYRLRRAVWGQGLATEGSAALLQHAFTVLQTPRVIATTMTVNVASRRVMEKIGLRYLSTFHLEWPEPIEGTEHGDVLYGITRDEYAAATRH
jgi:RimJ/RimL family protein N-acetyltransferase